MNVRGGTRAHLVSHGDECGILVSLGCWKPMARLHGLRLPGRNPPRQRLQVVLEERHHLDGCLSSRLGACHKGRSPASLRPRPKTGARIPLIPGGPAETLFLPARGARKEDAMLNLLLIASLAVPVNEDLEAKALAIKPAPRELTWLAVPWVLNLAEAQKVARQEKRPILLWVTGDDPLERC